MITDSDMGRVWREMFRGVAENTTPQKLIEYLTVKGWKCVADHAVSQEWIRRRKNERGGNTVDLILVPMEESYADFVFVLATALSDLSILEGWHVTVDVPEALLAQTTTKE